MRYQEFGGCENGMYFTKFVEEEVAQKRKQEEEPEEGVKKDHGEKEDQELDY